jgi:hypothetical protein
MIFSVCVIFGVFLINQTGIGGSEFGVLDVWDLIRTWSSVGIVIFCAAVLLSLGGSGTRVFGSGLSERVTDAVSWGLIGTVYVMMTGYVANVFFKLDDVFPGLGTIIGSFFLIVVFVIFVLDLHESIQSGGKK